MPIFNDGQTKICEFGNGDIWVSLVKEMKDLPYNNGIGLSNANVIGEIGAPIEHGPDNTLADLDCHVWMIFKKVESIDVVIEQLEHVKEQMLAYKD